MRAPRRSIGLVLVATGWIVAAAGCGRDSGDSPEAAAWKTRVEAAVEARGSGHPEVADSLLEAAWREVQTWNADDRRRVSALRDIAAEFRPTRMTLADSIYARILHDETLDLADTLRSALEVEWASVVQRMRRPALAESLLRSALARDERVVGPEHARLVEDTHKLAWFLLSRGRFDESDSLYERSLELARAVYGDDHPRVSDALLNLAVSSRRLGNLERTETLYLRALSIAERSDGPHSARAVMVLSNYAFFLKGMGRNAEAQAILERMEEIRAAQKAAARDSEAVVEPDQR